MVRAIQPCDVKNKLPNDHLTNSRSFPIELVCDEIEEEEKKLSTINAAAKKLMKL